MGIEESIRTHLVDDTTVDVSSRIYPLRLPQGYTLPAISYQRISAERVHELSGPTGWAWARFQLDCWSSSYSGVRSLAESVRQSLDGYKGILGGGSHVGGIYIEGERDLFEEDAEIYRVTMDFLIPYKETA